MFPRVSNLAGQFFHTSTTRGLRFGQTPEANCPAEGRRLQSRIPLGAAMLHVLLMANLASAPPAPAGAKPVVVPVDEVPLLRGRETCSGPQGEVELGRAVWLKKGHAAVRTSAGRVRVRIDGEHLYMDLPGAR